MLTLSAMLKLLFTGVYHKLTAHHLYLTVNEKVQIQ